MCNFFIKPQKILRILIYNQKTNKKLVKTYFNKSVQIKMFVDILANFSINQKTKYIILFWYKVLNILNKKIIKVLYKNHSNSVQFYKCV